MLQHDGPALKISSSQDKTRASMFSILDSFPYSNSASRKLKQWGKNSYTLFYAYDLTWNLYSSPRSRYTTLSSSPASFMVFLKSSSGDRNTS